jgi:hypothetical protein
VSPSDSKRFRSVCEGVPLGSCERSEQSVLGVDVVWQNLVDAHGTTITAVAGVAGVPVVFTQ